MHLVWHESRIFLKPLPEFLLSYTIWNENLCKDLRLYGDAASLFLSYMWLVCNKSDFKIACEKALLPPEISWEEWVSLSKAILRNIDYLTFEGINPRYRHGELRLYRLNWIYRLCSLTQSFTNVVRGYAYPYHQYSTFFKRNTAWLVGVIGYVAVVLTAMQVGLSTNQLKDNSTFHAASYSFTIFSILGPLAILGIVITFVFVLVIFNAIYMLVWNKKQYKKRQYAAQDLALQPWIH
ncbi:hypothetical protein FGG08_006311 [Glutinoglossum americanum]|uniref:Uncharacterized protein n=1 Tax=Glutinoglossum americanum TaxID=1670608 RepID=A0A9P8I7M5_9PEZI|nr:hypothetical protein FGG08_006311 [Glutinoglossum americanum]